MTKGIIYIMSTVIKGVVKIGKTGSENFESRMYALESNGYKNVAGLKREFAIEVEDYDDKEVLLHTIFEKSRLADTELFAIDKDLVIQLLSSFDGKVIYPEMEDKEEIFDKATERRTFLKGVVPDGLYTLNILSRNVSAKARVFEGNWTLLKGSSIATERHAGVSKGIDNFRLNMPVDIHGRVLDDVDLGSCTPSYAGSVVSWGSINGWTAWKNEAGQFVDIYIENNI